MPNLKKWVLLLLCLAWPALAASPNPYLAQARVFFQAGEYQSCLKRLSQAERWDSAVPEQAEIALYNGLCKFNLRRAQEAREDFALALKLDGNVKLPPLTSPKIVQLFQSIPRPEEPGPTPPPPPPPGPPKDAPVEPPHPTLVPSPSTPEVVTGPAPTPARSRVGPLVLGGGAVVAAGAGILFGTLAVKSDASARAAVWQVDAVAQRQSAEGEALVANVSYAVAGAAAVAAVVWWLLQ